MKFYHGKVAFFTPDFEILVVLLTPALIDVSLIFKTGGIRAGVKGAGVKKELAEKGPIRYENLSPMIKCRNQPKHFSRNFIRSFYAFCVMVGGNRGHQISAIFLFRKIFTPDLPDGVLDNRFLHIFEYLVDPIIEIFNYMFFL